MKKPNNHPANDVQKLKSVLEQQYIHLLKMLTILEQEYQALSSNNLLQFEETLQRKHQQIKDLENIQPRLNTIESILGGVLSKSTFSAFIQQMPNGNEKSDLKSLWLKFQETLEQCNLQNKTNNKVLNASAINIKQALNILRGNTDQPVANVYGKTGEQQDKLQGHSLAIA